MLHIYTEILNPFTNNGKIRGLSVYRVHVVDELGTTVHIRITLQVGGIAWAKAWN